MGNKLENKVAVVTGGSAGIGMGTAKHFVVEGAQVFITGRRQSELDKAVAAIGGKVTAVRSDTSKLADIDLLYQPLRIRQAASTSSSSMPDFTRLGSSVK